VGHLDRSDETGQITLTTIVIRQKPGGPYRPGQSACHVRRGLRRGHLESLQRIRRI
jgi:hypothetical protein